MRSSKVLDDQRRFDCVIATFKSLDQMRGSLPRLIHVKKKRNKEKKKNRGRPQAGERKPHVGFSSTWYLDG